MQKCSQTTESEQTQLKQSPLFEALKAHLQAFKGVTVPVQRAEVENVAIYKDATNGEPS